MKDYLEVEYNEINHPVTTYPAKLAAYLFQKFDLKEGQRLLEIGSGRCEILNEFRKLGLQTYAVDSSKSAKEYATKAGNKFELGKIEDSTSFNFFKGVSFDIIFTKSFIEHINYPEKFAEAAYKRLNNYGKMVILTPDFETNYKIFYDDITHVKPFTSVSVIQLLELTGFRNCQVFKFRQLPLTWRFKLINILSILSGIIARPRTRNKWFRWSRELMLAGIGIKIDKG
jgi:SAM-dependent methyltransferase